jgi:membrane protease YdiL (CAAX protease family)
VKKAALQSLGFCVFLYALIYGTAGLKGSERFEDPILHVFLTGGLTLLCVGLLVARDEKPLAALKLERAPLLKTVGFGLLGVVGVYALNAAVTLTYLLATGGIQEKVAQKADWAFGLASIPLMWVIPLTMFVGFYEEVAFRGFLLRRLDAALGDRVADQRRRLVWAAVISGLIFGGLHGYQGVMGVLQTSAVGIALGLLAAWRGSTWPGIVAHFTIDAFGLFALKVLRPAAEVALKKLQASGLDAGM